MPLLTILAPLTPVEVRGMSLPRAQVEKVEVKAGSSPVIYSLTWQETEGGPIRRGQWREDQVSEIENAGGVAIGSNKLADLGRAMAAQTRGG